MERDLPISLLVMATKKAALVTAALLTLVWGAQANPLVPRYLAPLAPFPLAEICSDENLKRPCDLMKKGDYDAAYLVVQHMTDASETVDQKDALWALASSVAENAKSARVAPRERVYQLDRQALSLFPRSAYRPFRLLRLAIICFADGRFGEARSWFAAFLNDYPNNSWANKAALFWCETAIASRDFTNAVSALKTLQTRISSDMKPRLQADLAYALFELGRADLALPLCSEVVDSRTKLEELPPWTRIGLARFFKEKGDLKSALGTLKMVDEEPWQIEARMLEITWTSKSENSLLDSLKSQWSALDGHYERATAVLPLAISLSGSDSNSVRVEAEKILTEIKSGAYSPKVRFEATLALARALQKDGKKFDALMTLDELLWNLEENPFAATGLELYASNFKELFASLTKSDSLLASALFVRCQKNLSPSLIDESVWIQVRDALARAHLFDTLFKLSQWLPLRDRYPELAKSMEGLALALAKNPPKGEAILQELMNSEPYKSFAAHTLGILAWARKDRERAIELWRIASSYNDEHAQAARYRLLTALFDLGRLQEIVQFADAQNLTAQDKFVIAIALERSKEGNRAFDIWKTLEPSGVYPKSLVNIKLGRSQNLQEPWLTFSDLYNKTGLEVSSWRE